MTDDDRTRIRGAVTAPPRPRAAAAPAEAASDATIVRPARQPAAPTGATAPGFAGATRPGFAGATAPGFSGGTAPGVGAPTEGEPAFERKSTVDVGEVLGHTYEIVAFLARGGMGAVYRAKHQILESDHAIKLIVPELARDPDIIGLMKQEAKALRKVKNDAVVEYQGLFLDEHKRRYLVMEFVDGPSLASVLAERKLKPAEVRTLRDRLALGLAAAHDKGVYHRDLSPDNIILPGGRIENAKIIDFGIAKSVEPGDKTFLDDEFAGKYSYVSPEQAGLFGGKIDGRSDIYSLGLVLVAAGMGFGQKLSMGNSPETVQAARQKVPDLSAIASELRDEIARMLQPQPDDRPASMRDIVSPEALAAAGEGGVIAPQINVKRLVAIAGGVVAVLATLAGAHVAYPRLLGSLVATDPAAVAADVRKALGDFRCSTFDVAVTQDYLFRNTVRISGYAPTQDDVKRVAVELAGIRSVAAFDNSVQVVEWPFCEAIRLAYTLSGGPANPDRAPAVRAGNRPELVFRDGEAIQLQVTSTPAFDGYLYLDLFDTDGGVIHMLPTPKRPDNAVKAGQVLTIGAAKGGPSGGDTLYQVGPPFGANFVLATAAAAPLFSAPRPQVEQAGDYLEALRKAMEGAQQAAARPMSYFRYLETAAMPK